MKVRSGFVSNSSSSSFIVEVPMIFKVSLDDLNNDPSLYEYDEFCDMEDCYDHEEDKLKQKAVDMLNAELSSLASGSQYWRYSHWNSGDIFWSLTKILEANNLVVMTTDGPGGDGQDCIIPFKDMRKKQ